MHRALPPNLFELQMKCIHVLFLYFFHTKNLDSLSFEKLLRPPDENFLDLLEPTATFLSEVQYIPAYFLKILLDPTNIHEKTMI